MLAGVVAVAGLFGAASIAFEEATVQGEMNTKLSRTKETFNAIQTTLDNAESKAKILCPVIR